jgi:hypothetical protein
MWRSDRREFHPSAMFDTGSAWLMTSLRADPIAVSRCRAIAMWQAGSMRLEV